MARIHVKPAPAGWMAIVITDSGVGRGDVGTEIVCIAGVHADVVAADNAVLVHRADAALGGANDGVVFDQVSSSRVVVILANVNCLALEF